MKNDLFLNENSNKSVKEAPDTATYILQKPDASLPNAQTLYSLGQTGILKSVKLQDKSVLGIAVPGIDYPTQEELNERVEQAKSYSNNSGVFSNAATQSANKANESEIKAALAAVEANNAVMQVKNALNKTFIMQKADPDVPNAQCLSCVGNGILKNTVVQLPDELWYGVLSLAVPGVDYYVPGPSGVATLINGVAIVNVTKVTARSIISLTVQTPPTSGLSNMGTLYIADRIAGVNFTIKSTKSSDTSKIGWTITEPATSFESSEEF